ncbi:MAG: hypothetical protein IJZ07_00880 [Clostridia bacterium]|nr:hypothetical protein [Clostridia bacterium]
MKIVLYVFTAVFIVASAFVYTIQEYENLTLLIGNINGDMIMQAALTCAAVCLIIISVIAIIKKEKRRILKTVICLAASFSMLCCVGISSFFSQSYTYYDFTSPDGEYTVIAAEWSWLRYGGITFYERTNPVFVKKAGGFSANYGYQPIEKGDYSVEWNENKVIFTLNKGDNYYETIAIKMS